MDRQKIINGLEFTKAMITFDPSTGKDIDPGSLNELDKTTYDACVGAIAMLKEQEPIWNDVLNVWTCPSCGQMVSTNYCRDCGQKVKWE